MSFFLCFLMLHNLARLALHRGGQKQDRNASIRLSIRIAAIAHHSLSPSPSRYPYSFSLSLSLSLSLFAISDKRAGLPKYSKCRENLNVLFSEETRTRKRKECLPCQKEARGI